MKRNEVSVWIDYHGSLFPEWKYARSESPEAKKVSFVAICKALLKVELDNASEASDRMLAGTVKKPFRDEDHVAAIVAASHRIRSERYAHEHPTVDGQPTVSCLFCGDTGFVECWRRNLIDKMAVACSCKAGDGPAGNWIGSVGQTAGVQRYNPKFCYWVGDYSAYWMDIRARIEADKANGMFQTLEERKLAKEAENAF